MHISIEDRARTNERHRSHSKSSSWFFQINRIKFRTVIERIFSEMSIVVSKCASSMKAAEECTAWIERKCHHSSSSESSAVNVISHNSTKQQIIQRLLTRSVITACRWEYFTEFRLFGGNDWNCLRINRTSLVKIGTECILGSGRKYSIYLCSPS